MTRYEMEFALYGPQQRVTLSFRRRSCAAPRPPSRSSRANPVATKSRSINEITSYESAFKLELEAFHDSFVLRESVP